MRVTFKTTLFLAFCIFHMKAILLPFPKHQDLLNQISSTFETSQLSQIIQKQGTDIQKYQTMVFDTKTCLQGQVMGPNGCINLIMTFPDQSKEQSSQSKILLSQKQTPKNVISNIIQPSQIKTEVKIQDVVINNDVLSETILTENIQTAGQNKIQQNLLQSPETLLNSPIIISSPQIQNIEQSQTVKATTDQLLNGKQQSSFDIPQQVNIITTNAQPYIDLRPLTFIEISSSMKNQSYLNKPILMAEQRISLTQVNQSICQGVWIQSLQSCIPSVCPQKYEWNQKTQQCQIPQPKCKQGLIWNGKFCSPLQNVEKQFPKLNQTQQFARQISTKCAGNYCRYPVCPPKFTFIESTCLPTQKDIKCPKQNINHKGFCDPSYYVTIQNSCETWNGTLCMQKYWNKY